MVNEFVEEQQATKIAKNKASGNSNSQEDGEEESESAMNQYH